MDPGERLLAEWLRASSLKPAVDVQPSQLHLYGTIWGIFNIRGI